MKSPKRRFLAAAAFAAILVASILTSAAQPTINFPPGVNWQNATPEQLYQAIFDSVKSNPDAAVDIVTTSIESLRATGRYPLAGSRDSKETVDPDVPSTLEDITGVVVDAATKANPSMAPQIISAASGAVPTWQMPTGDSGGGGGLGGGGGGGAVLMPSGAAGGSGGGGSIY